MTIYRDNKGIAALVEAGDHRGPVGDMWEAMGELQLSFLQSKGLKPEHRLLDIGCGSLRGGVKFVAFVDAGNYYGTDLNRPFLDAGYDKEIKPLGLADRLPRENLIEDGEFDFTWAEKSFDFAIAQSVFTHLPLGELRKCLHGLWPHMRPGGKFFATFFEVDRDDVETMVHQPGGMQTHRDKDPFHFTRAAVESQSDGLPWEACYVGNWEHPRSQRMILYTRTTPGARR
jgi:SAM-dependent methyltransferase